MVILLFNQSSVLFPQVKGQKASRQSALESFSKNNFENAYSQFGELSVSYPKDPLYKYYCGVCLVKLNREPAKAAALLQDALKGSAAIRSVPSDCSFYLGRAWQMSGNFRDAIKSYNFFTEQVGRKASKEAGVPQYLQQCNDRKGRIETIEVQKPVQVKNDSLIKPPVEIDMKIEKVIAQPVDTFKRQEDQLPGKYDTLLTQALDYQLKADSLSDLASRLRTRSDSAGNGEKADLKGKARNMEQLASSNQKTAGLKLAEAERLIAKPGVLLPDTITREKIVDHNLVKADSIKSHKAEPAPGSKKDTIPVLKEKQPEKEIVRQAAKPVQKIQEIFSIFEIAEKPVYSANEKVTINPEVPSGLIYRIQVAVFRNPVAASYFKGIKPVSGFRGEGAEVSNYYAGMFRKSSDAAKALIRVKTIGFKDAFVVALFDKKIVSNERAAILEKEWGSKSLLSATQKSNDMPRDTVPPTLVFRVEVMKSAKPVAEDLHEDIKRIAGNRGLDIIINEMKQNVYLVGTFLTFQSASEYADLIVRNGLKDAKVVAYLGKREIPVETARQLFEKY